MGIISVQEQLEIFAGLVYLPATNRVKLLDGTLVDQKRFNVLFPGRYALDVEGAGSVKAWHAFTQSQAYKCPIG